MGARVGNLAQRILTAAVGVPILLLLIYAAPPWAFPLAVAACAAAGGYEFFRFAVPRARRLHVVGPACVFLIVEGVAAAHGAHRDATILATILGLTPIVSLLTFLIRPGDLEQVPRQAGLMALGLLYVSLTSFIALLYGAGPEGPDLVVLLLTIAFFGDTGAYFGGRAFGRHPLYLAVSPKKTWEGAAFGLAASAGAALLAHFTYLPELPLLPGVGLALLAGVLGQAGDLSESMLKRASSVKDSGGLLPGHGGMLDRIDALLFAAPTLYLAMTWLDLLPLG